MGRACTGICTYTCGTGSMDSTSNDCAASFTKDSRSWLKETCRLHPCQNNQPLRTHYLLYFYND